MKNQLPEEAYLKRFGQKEEDIRGPYFRDQTAIIHSFPFRRLKRKAQVFFAPENDHICTRIEHVLHVFTNSTTICKGLINEGWELNTEMLQAIALGHDLGHAPFGHAGEEVLSEIQFENLKTKFHHEVNSLRVVDHIANRGDGLRLTYGVRDGIVSHCGEMDEQRIEPDFRVMDLEQLDAVGKRPASLEGCIVRFSDKISFLGRDVEDAVKLKLFTPDELPSEILNYLEIDPRDVKSGMNSAFLKAIIPDVIETSAKNGAVSVSDEAFEVINTLQDFSRQNMYKAEIMENYKHYVEKILPHIFNTLSDIFDKHGFDIDWYTGHFIRSYRQFGGYLAAYKDFFEGGRSQKAQIIIDYISGMSDNYAINFSKDVSIPKVLFK